MIGGALFQGEVEEAQHFSCTGCLFKWGTI